jgi:hypothetical protein
MNVHRLTAVLGVLTQPTDFDGGSDGLQSLIIKPTIGNRLVRVLSVANNHLKALCAGLHAGVRTKLNLSRDTALVEVNLR